MAEKLWVYYTKLGNMGDRLNELILERCFGYEAERCSFLDGELCAIGSCLGQYTLHGTPPMRLRQRINGIRKPRVAVWGTGFINYTDREGAFFKRDMRFCAVRGELTRRDVEHMTGKRLDIPTGDAGILASELLEKRPAVRYEVGIVPHLCDRRDPAVERLAASYDNAVVIDVREDPLETVREIASCRRILASSLHGLIVADSFGIPNLHTVFSDRPLGDGYKYDDYYSAYGVSHNPWDLREGKAPEPGEIEDRYRIRPEMTEEKKRILREAFPFPDRR